MPSLKELREQAGEQLNQLKAARDEYSKAREEKKPESEIAERKKAFGEIRAKLDGLNDQIEAEMSDADMQTAVEDYEKKFGAGSSRSDKPASGNDDDTPPPPDDGAQSLEDWHQANEDRSYLVHAWCCRAAGVDIGPRHREAIKRQKVRLAKQFTSRLYSNSQRNKLQRLYRDSHPAAVDLRTEKLFESRAMTTTTGSSGGFAISQGFVQNIESNMLAFSGVLQVADVMRTPSGNDLPWPTDDDTSNEGEQVDENTSIDGSTEPTLAQITFKAFKIHSKMVKVPYELLEDWDAVPDFDQWLSAKLGERLGRHRNDKYTTGVGTTEPSGIVTDSTLGITAASATALTGDEVLRLIHSVDPSYRMGPGVGFMMHDSIFLEVQLLKDQNDQYLHTPGLADGVRDRIRGYPVFVNQHMDSALAIDNVVALFGRLSAYKVREVNGIRMKRLDERYADVDQVAFDALFRHDGHLLDAGTAPVKHLVMAAA